jgi:hypothetical protein
MKIFGAAFPILPGKTEAGKEFAKAVMGPRRKEFEEILKKEGITKETWFLQKTPHGDFVVVYFEAADVEKSFEILAKSQDPFARWFREQAKAVSGVDLEQRAEPPEQIVSVGY